MDLEIILIDLENILIYPETILMDLENTWKHLKNTSITLFLTRISLFQVCFPNIWRWRRWSHLPGGSFYGDQIDTEVVFQDFWLHNKLRCCRWWWARIWKMSSCRWLSTGDWQWHQDDFCCHSIVVNPAASQALHCIALPTSLILVSRTFQYADKDSDGRISFEDFESIIGKLGGLVHKKMVVQVWREGGWRMIWRAHWVKVRS